MYCQKQIAPIQKYFWNIQTKLFRCLHGGDTNFQEANVTDKMQKDRVTGKSQIFHFLTILVIVFNVSDKRARKELTKFRAGGDFRGSLSFLTPSSKIKPMQKIESLILGNFSLFVYFGIFGQFFQFQFLSAFNRSITKSFSRERTHLPLHWTFRDHANDGAATADTR